MSDFLGGKSFDDFLNDDEIKASQSSTSITAPDAKFLGSKDYRQLKLSNETSVYDKDKTGVQDVFGLASLNAFSGYTHNCIEHTDIDKDIFDDTVLRSPIMKQTMQEGFNLSPTFEYLYEDLFYGLFKYDATLINPHSMHYSSKVNYEVVSAIVQTPEFIALRKTSRGDVFNSAYGCEILGKNLIDIMTKIMDRLSDIQKNLINDSLKKEKAIDAQQDLLKDQFIQLEDLVSVGQGGSDVYNQLLQETQDTVSAVASSFDEMTALYATQYDTLMEEQTDNIQEFTKEINNPLTQATFEINDVNEKLGAWGLEDSNGSVCTGIETKRELLDAIRNSNKLKKLTDMIGKFASVAADEQKKKTKHGKTDIETVTTGGNYMNALPSELMNLAIPQTKSTFYKKMSEKSLLSYQKNGNEKRNKGPIIAMLDTSGSIGSDEELWEKAIACAMLDIAQKQKRDFACIIYSSRSDEPIIISKDEICPSKILKIANTYHGGGTDFESPINKAVKLLDKTAFKNADLIMITDGDCGISQTFLKTLKEKQEEKEFSIYGVLINMGGGRCSSETLDKFCDEVHLVSDITELTDPDSKVTRALFGSI